MLFISCIFNVLKAKVTNDLFLIGFIPGLLAMFFGSSLAGRGIFKRSIAYLKLNALSWSENIFFFPSATDIARRSMS